MGLCCCYLESNNLHVYEHILDFSRMCWIACKHSRAVGETETGEHPEGHAEAAVDESLDVHSVDTWIELGTPRKVLHIERAKDRASVRVSSVGSRTGTVLR